MDKTLLSLQLMGAVSRSTTSRFDLHTAIYTFVGASVKKARLALVGVTIFGMVSLYCVAYHIS